jgi:hypothetical protein
MSKPTEGPGVMREACFSQLNYRYRCRSRPESPRRATSKKRLMDVTTFGSSSSVAVFAELLLRFGMIHLLLAAARVMKIQTRRARV